MRTGAGSGERFLWRVNHGPQASAPTKPRAGFYWLAVLLVSGRFAIWVLGNAADLASTGGVFKPRLDP